MRKHLMLCAMLFALPAHAAHWVVDDAKSSLTFSGKQSDEMFRGAFRKFTSDIEFDEKKPEDSHIHISVDMSSFTIDGKDRTAAFPTDEWLNVKQFPTAEFTAAQVRKTGEHEYEALGDLTLHGVSKTVAVAFRLATKNGVTEVDGNAALMRNDFRIGGGRWADDQWVAFPVSVQFHLVAKPK